MVEANAMQGSSKNDEIGTPLDMYRWLDKRYKFDYDAAASFELHKASTFSTKDGTYRLGLSASENEHFEQIDPLDGLHQEWYNRRVFCNPPYSRGLFGSFIDKAIDERNSAEIIVMLVKADTSTKNWQRLEAYAHIDLLKRVKYQGMDQGATFASALALIRPDNWRPE